MAVDNPEGDNKVEIEIMLDQDVYDYLVEMAGGDDPDTLGAFVEPILRAYIEKIPH